MRLSLKSAAIILGCIAASATALPASAQTQEQPAEKQNLPDSTKRVQETIGDWGIDCSERAGERKRCKMMQQIANAKTMKAIVTWLIGRDGQGKPAMSIQTPPGILLPPGLTLSIDGKMTITLPYRTCTQQVCEAVHPLTGEIIEALKSGKAAKVTVSPLEGEPRSFEMSLRGFTAAFDASGIK